MYVCVKACIWTRRLTSWWTLRPLSPRQKDSCEHSSRRRVARWLKPSSRTNRTDSTTASTHPLNKVSTPVFLHVCHVCLLALELLAHVKWDKCCKKCLFCGNASARELAKKYMLIIYADYAWCRDLVKWWCNVIGCRNFASWIIWCLQKHDASKKL